MEQEIRPNDLGITQEEIESVVQPDVPQSPNLNERRIVLGPLEPINGVVYVGYGPELDDD